MGTVSKFQVQDTDLAHFSETFLDYATIISRQILEVELIFEFENILAPFWSCEVNFFFHGWMPNADIIVFVFAALQERHLMVQTTNDVTFILNYAYT